jgi:hypothetical protein
VHDLHGESAAEAGAGTEAGAGVEPPAAVPAKVRLAIAEEVQDSSERIVAAPEPAIRFRREW